LPLHRIVPHATATTELYTLSLHDALPIFHKREHLRQLPDTALVRGSPHPPAPDRCFLLRPQTGRRIPHQRAHVPRRQSLPSPGTCLQTLDPLSGISWKTHWQCNSPVHPCSSDSSLPPPAPRSH